MRRSALLLVFCVTLLAPQAGAPASRKEALRAACSTSLESARRIGQFFTGQSSVFHAPKEKKTHQKVARGLQETLRAAIRFFSPLPNRFLETPTEPIFRSQWADPSYQPSSKEVAVLQKYDALSIFEKKKFFMQSHPLWTRFRKLFDQSVRAAIAASFALAINNGYQAHASLLSGPEFIQAQHQTTDPYETALIVDYVPFPHLAILIGENVYSFGYTHLTVRPLSIYLQARDETAVASTLESLPRSVEAIELKLSLEEARKLKHALVLKTAQRYKNITFVNDCSTMVMRALRANTSVDVSQLIDASPSQVAMYFSLRKLLGDVRVGTISQIALEDTGSPMSHLIRNTAINAIESRMFLSLLGIDQSQRAFVDFAYDESELTHLDPEVESEMQSWKEDVDHSLTHDRQIAYFESLGDALRRDPELAQIASGYFDREISRSVALATDAASDLRQILFHQYRAELLIKKKLDLLGGDSL